MKKVLLLKSPFNGIGKHIEDIVMEYGGVIELVSLKYSGNIPHPKNTEDKYNRTRLYLPTDFKIEPQSRNDKQEVTSLRLSDILKSLKYFDVHFERGEGGLILKPKHPFHSATYEPKGDERAIERIASLIDIQADGILTVWSEHKGGFRYWDDMSQIHQFFGAICEQNQKLFLIKDSCERKSPLSSISEYFGR